MGQLFTEAERAEVWDRWQSGESMRSIAHRLRREASSVRTMLKASGGVRPVGRRRRVEHLTVEEREEISRGLAAGSSMRSIARRLGRPASTVSREIARNGGVGRYRAQAADRAAVRRARRPKRCKLASNPRLALIVTDKLTRWWSPEQTWIFVML